MRIDVLLDKLCLVKHRSIAKNACDKDLVLLNGEPVKPSKKVHVGDRIKIMLYGFIVECEVTEIPKGNVSKSDAQNYYKLLVRNQ
ncbi:MAG TPA: RNA-binding protein [Candidatus Cloacimonetes bacterium]|nr:RNA-binding protein [Candidatus Cloacimonadota bacterium]HEX38076.1 RNA-binding protein [Candidatus Cloacimonadota bacterium]